MYSNSASGHENQIQEIGLVVTQGIPLFKFRDRSASFNQDAMSRGGIPFRCRTCARIHVHGPLGD